MLEAKALDEDIPEQDDLGTRPDNAAMLHAAGPEIEAFRVHDTAASTWRRPDVLVACIACSCHGLTFQAL